MRRVVILVVVCAAPLLSAAETATVVTFIKGDLGKVPTGWEVAQTGKGEGSVWKVVEDKSSPSKSGYALAQLADGPRPLFNLCVLKESKFQDGEVSVMIKAIKGAIDQGGGVVWRYQDADNYYIARYNPLESNYRAYKVVDGKRIQLATEEDVELPEGKWFSVSIKQTGTAIECSLNGKKILEAKDDSFKDAGKVGLWTKADAVCHFDRLEYTPTK